METAIACRVSAHDPVLEDVARRISSAAGCPERALLLQVLLQLPRLADEHGGIALSTVEDLTAELARELPPAPMWTVACEIESPRVLWFRELEASEANDTTEHFHYLRSARPDGRSYGLLSPHGELVAMCVTSPLDVPYLREMLGGDAKAPSPRVLSRVFAFEGAPHNSISYLLSRTARAERGCGVTDMVTYVNPNMGFTGSSYRASGWRLLGTEPGTSYRYLDGRYVTDRRLAATYGPGDDRSYRQLLGNRFSVSTMPLEPLLVFHRRVV